MGSEQREPRGRNWEMVSGIVAIVVGVAALGISAYTAYLEHRHAQAEVWPRLEISTSDMGGGFKIVIANKGTGPATIRDWKRRLHGKPVTTWTPWIDTIVGHHVPIGDFMKSRVIDETLSPGETVTFFATGDTSLQPSFDAFDDVLGGTLCYCSVFEDCWVVDGALDAHKPVPVPQCSVPGPDSWVGMGAGEWRELAALYAGHPGDAGARAAR